MRVLIIDDSRFTRGLIRRDLSGLHEVIEAENGIEGLRLMETEPPDLILVDLLMPQMDGFEFLRELRHRGFTGPVVVCSANAQTSVEARIRELGAARFIGKPELLSAGRAREVVAAVMQERESGPAAAAPATRADPGLGEIVDQAMLAVSDVLAWLVNRPVAIDGDGSDAERSASRGHEAPHVRVSVRLGGAVSGTACLHLPGFELLDAAADHLGPVPGEAPTYREIAEEVGNLLLSAFVSRFAAISGREITISDLRCELEPGRETARDDACDVEIQSAFHVGGIPETGEIQLRLRASRVVQLRSRVPLLAGGG